MDLKWRWGTHEGGVPLLVALIEKLGTMLVALLGKLDTQHLFSLSVRLRNVVRGYIFKEQ